MVSEINSKINPVEMLRERKLIWKLAKNDFKTKFAGSYLGTIWAFVQPVITVLVYWFVFEKALGSAAQTTRAGIEAPFLIWLIAGLVPWFFFQDAMNGGTGALLEYNYLVKKVVFKINILPVVKIVSALFVHLFFLAVAVLICIGYGIYPNWYMLQVFYYAACMVLLTMGLVYATSAIVIFFRDMAQIVAIAIQIGVWATPIMWNIDSPDMAERIPEIVMNILKLNPMYYVVNGYRDALINQVAFWEYPGLTAYFWVFTVLMLWIGTSIFKKLRVHFADML